MYLAYIKDSALCSRDSTGSRFIYSLSSQREDIIKDHSHSNPSLSTDPGVNPCGPKTKQTNERLRSLAREALGMLSICFVCNVGCLCSVPSTTWSSKHCQKWHPNTDLGLNPEHYWVWPQSKIRKQNTQIVAGLYNPKLALTREISNAVLGRWSRRDHTHQS